MPTQTLPDFSKAAKTYGYYNSSQYMVFRELLKRAKNRSPQSILDIGSATGAGTEELQKQFKVPVQGLDCSQAMVDWANAHHNNASISYHCADASQYSLEKPVDLIFSNATFQWISNLESLSHCIKQNLSKDGRVLFSVFLPSSLRELSRACKELFGDDFILPCETFSKVDEYKSAFSWAKEIRPCQQKKIIHSYPSVKDLLKTIKHSGTAGKAQSPFFTRGTLSTLDQIMQNDNTITATYDVALFEYQK